MTILRQCTLSLLANEDEDRRNVLPSAGEIYATFTRSLSSLVKPVLTRDIGNEAHEWKYYLEVGKFTFTDIAAVNYNYNVLEAIAQILVIRTCHVPCTR